MHPKASFSESLQLASEMQTVSTKQLNTELEMPKPALLRIETYR